MKTTTKFHLTAAFACCAALLLLFGAHLQAQTRQVGPEPGLAFQVPPSGTGYCSYGEYTRTASSTTTPSSWGGNCAVPMIKYADTLLTNASEAFEKWTQFPWTVAQQFNVKVHADYLTGLTGYIYTFWATQPRIAMNVADPNFQSYVFDQYFPDLFLPHGPGQSPTYVAVDGYTTDWGFVGAIINGSWFTPTAWDIGFPQTKQAWLDGFKAFFAYAKVHAAQIRLSPHLGWMNPVSDWSQFQSIYANVPAIETEFWNVSKLHYDDKYTRSQRFNQMLQLNWFANRATPVFAGDPPTRILRWGVTPDNGDYHTALATYAMVRGPNSFFDCTSPDNHIAADPSRWLSVANHIGKTISNFQVLATAYGRAVGDGYNLLARTFPDGKAFLNMTGSTRTISLPSGSRNWSGTYITSITLADGKGEVVLN